MEARCLPPNGENSPRTSWENPGLRALPNNYEQCAESGPHDGRRTPGRDRRDPGRRPDPSPRPKSSPLSPTGESSLDCPAHQSGHANALNDGGLE